MELPASALTGFSPAEGRDIAALQDARPCGVVGARSATGDVGFATVIWVTPVSHSPALVAFALRAKSHTMGIIRETGRFSLSVPVADEEGVRIIEFCGGNTGRMVSKGEHVDYAIVDDVPVVAHSFSWEVGKVESIQEAGDHLLVVGSLTRAETKAARDERGQLVPWETLLCVQHGAYGVATPLKHRVQP